MAIDENGFIILSRNLCDHWVWLKAPVSYGQAWVDLLLMANYKPKKIPYKGGTIEGKSGTVYRSIRWLSERWGWSRAKVRRFIKLLESDGMVNANVTTNKTTITIVNYEKYQHRPKAKKTTNVTTNDTTNGQQTDSERTASGQRVDTYNKDNKDNKDNKETKKIEPEGSEAEQEEEPDWEAIWESLPDIEGTGE